MPIDVNQNLTPHFKLREFLKNGSAEGTNSMILQNIKRMAQYMELVRFICGNRPITITAGFRTPEHNAEIGGASNSWHLKGLACDFLVKGMTPLQVEDLLNPIWPCGLEVALDTHCHLDLRPDRARFAKA